jgi:hypothetical protein
MEIMSKKNKKDIEQDELEFSPDDFEDSIDTEAEVAQFVEKTDTLTSKIQKAQKPSRGGFGGNRSSGYPTAGSHSKSGSRGGSRGSSGSLGGSYVGNSYGDWEKKQKEREKQYRVVMQKAISLLNDSQLACELGVDAAGDDIVLDLTEETSKRIVVYVNGTYLVRSIDPENPVQNFRRKILSFDMSYGNVTLDPTAMRFLIRNGCFDLLEFAVWLEDIVETEVTEIRTSLTSGK